MNYETLQIRIEKIAQNAFFFYRNTFVCRASSIKKSEYCCHSPFHPPIFCRHSLKLLSPTLPISMNWILLSPPPLSSDLDTPKIWNVHLIENNHIKPTYFSIPLCCFFSIKSKINPKQAGLLQIGMAGGRGGPL